VKYHSHIDPGKDPAVGGTEAGYPDLVDDLVEEQTDLHRRVVDRDHAAWTTATPAEGWTVRDQIGHLAMGEDLATLAATDPGAFAAEVALLLGDLDATLRDQAKRVADTSDSDLLDWWWTSAAATVDGLKRHQAADRLPWVAGDMSAMSFATARLMETWAHGQDIVDALADHRAPTDRLFHIADLGVRTRGFAYRNRQLVVPVSPVRVELTAPSGARWAWGDQAATDHVAGSALDFCLVVTQRRTVEETALTVAGRDAVGWMRIAQVFAGPPTSPHPRVQEKTR
jgi:uncharacterized protein (TIGR03084 family)